MKKRKSLVQKFVKYGTSAGGYTSTPERFFLLSFLLWGSALRCLPLCAVNSGAAAKDQGAD